MLKKLLPNLVFLPIFPILGSPYFITIHPIPYPKNKTNMGFNLSGIVISKNYKDNVNELQEQLGLNLELDKEISFQEASANWKDRKICDIYFGEYGTLLFVSMDMCVDEAWFIEDGNTLTFALSETSMAFSFNYYEADKLVRSFMEVEGRRLSEEGEKLPIEETGDDSSEIIWKQLGAVLGQTFWSVNHDEKAFRYNIV